MLSGDTGVTSQARCPKLDEVARTAVKWAVLMHSGEMSDDQRRAFERWISDDDRNRTAWQRLESALVPFAHVGEHGKEAAREALVLTDASRRKFLRNGIAVIGVLGVTGWAGGVLLQRRNDVQYALNLRTGLAERKDFVMADQTHLFIDAKTTVQGRRANARSLLLRNGTMYADVAADRAGSMFSVETSGGWIRTAAAALEIAATDNITRVSVHRSRAVIETAGGLHAMLQPGDVVEFGRHYITRLATALSASPSWIKGLYVASDVPLAAVIDALRPYYRGFIRITPEAAQRRVSGVFPLDDAQRALEQIAQTLSVDVTTYANCVVIISAR